MLKTSELTGNLTENLDDMAEYYRTTDENRKQIHLKENLMFFITNLQTEVHNTAIEYNQKLMNKQISKSSLDEIKGIGPKKKQELLRKFGSVEAIKKASLQEILEIKGINKELAQKIIAELNEKV